MAHLTYGTSVSVSDRWGPYLYRLRYAGTAKDARWDTRAPGALHSPRGASAAGGTVHALHGLQAR